MNRSALAAILAAISASVLILIGGWAGYALAANRHAARLADLKASVAQAQSAQSARVLEAEREAARITSNMEAAHAAWERTRREAEVETARLERELGDAVGRLRRSGGDRGAGGLPQPADAARGCADLREANARLADAVERLVAGGGSIVADGQSAADVAGTAAEWARQIGGGR